VGASDERIEELIEQSGGFWVDDEFRINCRDLTQLIRDASQERADAGKDSALTDEQIRAVADQHLHWGKVTYVNANLNSIVAFARAILAAKEKK
jgi:hypothetical protein